MVKQSKINLYYTFKYRTVTDVMSEYKWTYCFKSIDILKMKKKKTTTTTYEAFL